jgi:phosphate transport system permease protein
MAPVSNKFASPAARGFRETAPVRRHRQIEHVAHILLACSTAAMVLPLIAIVAFLIIKALPVLSVGFLLEAPSNGMRAGGIWPALLGTIYLVMTSLAIATPIGIAAAIYLHEYARDSALTRAIQLAVVNLAGVPSIVHALFGLGAFVLFAGIGRSILAASLTLAVMTLPVIIASTREALAAVPHSFREACWNLGATRWQTIRHIVLPNSISGILTGLILQVSRTAGETAPVMLTGAVFYKSVPSGDLFAYGLRDQCMALSMHLFTISTQVPDVPDAVSYGTAVVLVGSVLALNTVAIAVRVYLRTRKKW